MCYGMHCPYEDMKGECTWKSGRRPVPCEREELEEDEDWYDPEEERIEMEMERRKEEKMYGYYF